MKKIIDLLKQPFMNVGYLYFYIHFITEIVCFYALSCVIGDSVVLWMTPFIYDAFAFVPQSLIGYFSDKHPTNIGLIGVFLLVIGFVSFIYNLIPIKYIGLIILCLGNAFIHVAGAEVTLRTSEGKLSPSAIFVSGGSFGVIMGKLLAKQSFCPIIIIVLALTMIPFVLLAEYYKKASPKKNYCKDFNYQNSHLKPTIIVILAVFIVIVRGYMGYGIPTSWNKTVFEAVLFYFTMGFGKAFGGICCDIYGIRKTAFLSIVGSFPFLIFGDNLMLVSIIGILMFSMTMSITLGILVSVLKNTPGLAFGLTTIGLFLGTVPIFFFKITSVMGNCLVIFFLTVVCFLIVDKIIRKDTG